MIFRLRPPQQLGHCRRGATAVEFALILPALLLMIIGIIESGYAVFTKNSIRKALSDTTRWAYTAIQADGVADTEASVRTHLRNLATGVSLELDNIAVTYDPPSGGCSNNTQIQVTVTYPYNSLFSDLIPFSITFQETLRSPLQCWPAT